MKLEQNMPISTQKSLKNGITFFQMQISPPLRWVLEGFYSSNESWKPKFSRGVVKSSSIWRKVTFLELLSGMELIVQRNIESKWALSHFSVGGI